MIKYNIIASGSQGNAVQIEDIILIDCGVPFKSLKGIYKDLKLVLLTHIHTDHFKKRTIKALSEARPTLRFACGGHLVKALVECGVDKRNIDVLSPNRKYSYGTFSVIPFELLHNVKNFGYRVHFESGKRKLFYATDTNNLDGIVAYGYDLYMVEANYTDEQMKERIERKQAEGIYPYEYEVMQNHLSKQKADNFIYENIGVTEIYSNQQRLR